MTEATREDIHNTIDSASEKAHAAVDQAAQSAENLQQAVGDVTDTAVRIKDHVVKAAVDDNVSTQQTLESIGDEVSQLVRRYPLAALAVGFGVGMLLGRTINRS